VPVLPYGPPNVRLIRPTRLPQGVRDAGVALVERKLSNSTVRDLVSISDADWQVACRRFNATQQLAKRRGRLQARVASIAKMFDVTDRTVRRWLATYRKNPDIVALLPKPRGQTVGTRRLRPDTERLLNDVIDVWAAKAEHLPIAWILEECKRRTRTARLSMPSRRAIDARLRDRGLDGLARRQFAPKADAAVVLTPRSRKALAIVQMDHTLVDIMVVDEVLRQSMGRPWITVAFDIATRVVLGFALRLKHPSRDFSRLAIPRCRRTATEPRSPLPRPFLARRGARCAPERPRTHDHRLELAAARTDALASQGTSDTRILIATDCRTAIRPREEAKATTT
jgi:hypothetical protein